MFHLWAGEGEMFGPGGVLVCILWLPLSCVLKIDFATFNPFLTAHQKCIMYPVWDPPADEAITASQTVQAAVIFTAARWRIRRPDAAEQGPFKRTEVA